MVDDSPDPDPDPDPQPPDDGGGNGGGQGGDGLSREVLIGGAAVAGLGVAYLSSRN